MSSDAIAVTHGFCAYSVSGYYGPFLRYVYYALLLLSFVFHKTEWLVVVTLGPAMLIGATVDIHAIALAVHRGQGTVDLDIIPAFAIAGVGLVVAVPMMLWSRTLRNASSSSRMALYLWTPLNICGSLASMATLKALPHSVPCTVLSECSSQCEVTLPMRQGQAITFIAFKKSWRSFLFDFSGYLCGFGIPISLIALWATLSPPTGALVSYISDPAVPDPIQRVYSRGVASATMATLACTGAAIASIVYSELILQGPDRVPLAEAVSTFGQWSILVTAFIGIFVALLKVCLERSKSRRPAEFERNFDHEERHSGVLRRRTTA
ncbi:hypothetical protein FQN54_000278 [Arachnomyces sp. PD_36]|nr:hypothetical protein FQN54_000278 [Arachnomyces sp. PD_36]